MEFIEKLCDLDDTVTEPGWHPFDPQGKGPLHHGTYSVITRTKGSLRTWIRNRYYWNGAYWVTPSGSPSKSIIEAYYVPEEAEE